MKLVSIVFDKTASEYKLYFKDEKTGQPYHITANHLLDKEKLWARGGPTTTKTPTALAGQ